MASGSLDTGNIGTQPWVKWVITWNGHSSSFTVTGTKQSGFKFTGGGWTVHVGFSGGNDGSVYVAAPTNNTAQVSFSTTVTVTPPSSGTLYFYATSTSYSSSGVISYANRKTKSYTHAYKITVQDRVGNSSGTLLGTNTTSDYHDYGSYVSARSLFPNTSYTGYTYSSDSGSTKVTGSITVFSYFTANTYTITYYSNDSNGTVSNMPSSGSISYGSNISSSVPTNRYRVTFDANGGTCSTSYLDSTRTFSSWNTAANGSGTTWSPGATFRQTSNLTLYAQWGNATSVTLPSATRTNYDFEGWATSSSATTGIIGSYTPPGNIILYAVWHIDGVIRLYVSTNYHSCTVWVYLGDGAGPKSDGWHQAIPLVYCTANGSTKFHIAG